MTGLSINNIHKSFGATHALRGISFEVAEGEIVAVLGPSGCGKSTLLALIAGLETFDKGELSWNGISLAGTPTHKRGFGLMFQDYMLFPHKNVAANVAFGLEMVPWEKAEINLRVAQVLNFVSLPDYGPRDVNTLSGGEQQRVALARSLAPSPRLLMLDEPFSSLDRTLRGRLIAELREILKQMNQTALYVTHDQEEAFTLADRVVVMNKGQVAQIGTPEMIFTKPRSVFVAQFLGFKNILEGELQDGLLMTSLGDFKIGGYSPTSLGHQVVNVLVRPDSFHITGGGSHQINAVVQSMTFRGNLSQVILKVKGIPLTFEFQSGHALPGPGEMVTLYFNPEEAIQIVT